MMPMEQLHPAQDYKFKANQKGQDDPDEEDSMEDDNESNGNVKKESPKKKGKRGRKPTK